MTNKQLYYINRGMLFLAVSYALNAYMMPSILCSIVSILMTNDLIGWKHLRYGLLKITFLSGVAIFLIKAVQLDTEIPVLLLAAIACAVFSSQWSCFRYATLSEIIQKEVLLMTGFVMIVCMLPIGIDKLAEKIVIIAVIFMPLIICYIFHSTFLKEYTNPLDKQMELR